VKSIGREPAVLTALLAIIVQALTAFGLNVSAQLQSIITAIVVVGFALFTARLVGDGLIAAITGFVQGFVSLFVYFGLDWSAEDQSKLMISVAVVAAFVVRWLVTAPVAAEDAPLGLPAGVFRA
jgi:hypothetical protein